MRGLVRGLIMRPAFGCRAAEMVIDRYKGYSVSRQREPNNYKVLDSNEVLQVYDERTGETAFTLNVFYNPKRILRIEDKERVIASLLAPAIAEVRRKIDAGDLTDRLLHVDFASAVPGGVGGQAPAQRG